MDDNVPQEMLPFFEGMNGSNQNQKFTCVLVLNLNHFESRDYNNKALILMPGVSMVSLWFPHSDAAPGQYLFGDCQLYFA